MEPSVHRRGRAAAAASCLGVIALAFGVVLSVAPRAATAANPPTGDPQGTIYVSDVGTNAIDVFAPGTNGNVAPTRVISGPSTGLSEPADVKVAANGDIYASNFGNNSITEYAPGASGDAVPTCTISGSNTGLVNNDDMSLEADGTLVVGNYNSSNGSVVVFAPGACGNATPTETLSGSNTGLGGGVDGVGTDAAGTIYADATSNGSIQIFAAGATGNVAPESTISGSNTGLSLPDDIVVGFNGELFITDATGGVIVFSPGATGNATPIQQIVGSNTGISELDDLAVDASGNIFATNSTGAGVLEWNAGATGNVAPNTSIVGSATTFSEPEGVYVTGPVSTLKLTSQVASSSITLGAGTSDTATLAGGSSPTGKLEFKLFGPNDSTCSMAPAYTSPFSTVTGDGAYPSPSFTPTAIGAYSWVDAYSGDTKNPPAETQCNDPNETVTVSSTTKTPTTTTTSLSGGGQTGGNISVPQNTPVTDQATLAGTNVGSAGGMVTYTVYSDANCTMSAGSGGTVSVTDGSVPVSTSVSLATPGTYYWQASYTGDTLNDGSISTCGSEVETVQGTVTTPTCTLTSIAVGPPSQMVFTVQDTGSGLSTVKAARHHNSHYVISGFTPGTTSPVTVTFTKKTETAGGSAGVKATNGIGNSVFCVSQYKTVKPLRVNSQGFTFRKQFDMLVIQNGSPGLNSVQITLNGSTSTVTLTPGETYTQTLAVIKGNNKMVVQGFGHGKQAAVAAVWGYLK
jgi:hypothetical protein